MNVFILDEQVYHHADWTILHDFDINFTNNDVEVLAIGLSEIIDDSFMKRFPNCRYILSPTTAVDHIRVTIPIHIIKLVPERINHINASSEFAFLLILSLLRKYPFAGHRENLIGNDLFGKIIGIIGFGRIGKKVDQYAKSFGAQTITYDTAFDTGFSLDDVIKKSDIILISCSACESNRKFMNDEKFSSMKKGSYFVNISRGFLVDEVSLLKHLNSGHLAGAALDVVDDYGLFYDYNNPNLIITPHIAGSTFESQKMACDFVISELLKDLKNEKH